eukprot:CAMPEP_0201905788 /NCGR_PEP_ID=MMETSP0902-20130614/56692_1 /ASSEMBLY_ACC=CAM_ASM_000551 /TAXON_ID=420261 /ORGANISM="Thalassiosira antarctica, Strain CCMP982" /LENGTH=161 /DNA_ID=CAMNT_0048439909 /DNA_START=27 /DNA_END=512 /DNA_ORIENTATION=+
MKIQAILFTLLHTKTVLSYEESQRQTSAANCSMPCMTQIRLSASKMKECLKSKCGTYGTDPNIQAEFVEDEAGDVEFPDNHTACGARCERLPFSSVRQEQCIKECELNHSPNHKSVTEDEHNITGNPGKEQYNPCVARCKRLGKAGCTNRCPTDDFYAAPS